MIHELKINPIYADEFIKGNKQWEIRKDDRNFKVGDLIKFVINGTIKIYFVEITYIFKGGEYELKKDYVIMTVKKMAYSEFEQLSNTF